VPVQLYQSVVAADEGVNPVDGLSVLPYPVHAQQPLLALVDKQRHHQDGYNADGVENREWETPVADGPVGAVVDNQWEGKDTGGPHEYVVAPGGVDVFDEQSDADAQVEVESSHVDAHAHL